MDTREHVYVEKDGVREAGKEDKGIQEEGMAGKDEGREQN